MADDVTAALAGIKERAKAAADFPLAEFAALIDHDTKTVGGWISASALDVPSLVAAVEAVLKLAGEWDDGGTPMRALNEYRGRDQQQAGNAVLCAVRDCADQLREAITTALTGNGLGEDGEHA